MTLTKNRINETFMMNENSDNEDLFIMDDYQEDNLNLLNYEQILKLDEVLNETLTLCGACELPIICLTIKDFITSVKSELFEMDFPLQDIKLNGGAAASVLDINGYYDYNDVDFLINIKSNDDKNQCSYCYDNEEEIFSTAVTAILCVVCRFLQLQFTSSPSSTNETNSTRSLLNNSSMLSACRSYIHKQVRINNYQTGDSWSLITLGNNNSIHNNSSTTTNSTRIDLKFCRRMQRNYEFSIDSFQIHLDSLLTFYEATVSSVDRCCSSASSVVSNESNSSSSISTSSSSSSYYMQISPYFYPTVAVESQWPLYQQALKHLHERIVSTIQPELLRGGGLLKYCKLLSLDYQLDKQLDVQRLERYMCSRFFIDYKDCSSQIKAIESYLDNHFPSYASYVTSQFLDRLYNVISTSSICLMSHERHQILQLIYQLLSMTSASISSVSPLSTTSSLLNSPSTPLSCSSNSLTSSSSLASLATNNTIGSSCNNNNNNNNNNSSVITFNFPSKQSFEIHTDHKWTLISTTCESTDFFYNNIQRF